MISVYHLYEFGNVSGGSIVMGPTTGDGEGGNSGNITKPAYEKFLLPNFKNKDTIDETKKINFKKNKVVNEAVNPSPGSPPTPVKKDTSIQNAITHRTVMPKESRRPMMFGNGVGRKIV